MPKSPTATAIIVFRIGSRYEQKKYLGISHFLEHMVFKGNKLFPTPREVAAAIESVGGSFNAFTSKEFTGFHVRVGADFLDIALRWLGALVTRPLLSSQDAKMERKVIFEEINMYNDTPIMQVGDVFEELLFAGNSLGRSIIGNKKSLRAVNSPELKNYFSTNYLPSKAILAVAGNLEKFQRGKKTSKNSLLQKYFPFSNQKNFRRSTGAFTLKSQRENASKTKIVYKKTDQTHLIMGVRTFSCFDKRRYPNRKRF